MISYEYKGLMINPKTKQIPYIGSFKAEQEARDWATKHYASGKFEGLDLVIKKKLLINGKPVKLGWQHVIFALNISLLAYLTYRVLA